MKTADKDRPGAWLAGLTSAERKEVAMSRGLLAYFPDALALVARHSVRANEKHNAGQPVHWAREKSKDHEDCIIRHSAAVAVDVNSLDDGSPHIVCRAWRALAALQLWAEQQVEPPEPAQAKDAGAWTPWFGHGKPPLPGDTVVEIELCNGLGSRGVGPVKVWDWGWTSHSAVPCVDDIVRYRIVPQ
jgi:hypothetical protein